MIRPEDKEKTLYMIRRKSDGLYSMGGTTVKFSKLGKVWSGIGPLRNHLRQAEQIGSNIADVYLGCEILAFKMVMTQTPVEIEISLQNNLIHILDIRKARLEKWSKNNGNNYDWMAEKYKSELATTEKQLTLLRQEQTE